MAHRFWSVTAKTLHHQTIPTKKSFVTVSYAFSTRFAIHSLRTTYHRTIIICFDRWVRWSGQTLSDSVFILLLLLNNFVFFHLMSGRRICSLHQSSSKNNAMKVEENDIDIQIAADLLWRAPISLDQSFGYAIYHGSLWMDIDRVFHLFWIFKCQRLFEQWNKWANANLDHTITGAERRHCKRNKTKKRQTKMFILSCCFDHAKHTKLWRAHRKRTVCRSRENNKSENIFLWQTLEKKKLYTTNWIVWIAKSYAFGLERMKLNVDTMDYAKQSVSSGKQSIELKLTKARVLRH